jgi:hypothetical protein
MEDGNIESEKATISLQYNILGAGCCVLCAVCCVLCAVCCVLCAVCCVLRMRVYSSVYACMVYSVRILYNSNPSTLCNRTNSKARHTSRQRKQHQAFLEIYL